MAGFIYFKGLDAVNEFDRNNFYFALKLIFIPFIGIGFFIGIMDVGFFYKMKLKDKKWRFKLSPVRYYYIYLENNYSYKLIIIISILIGFMNSVCYFLYDIYFKLLLVFISLFSNFYPLKYYIGILVYGFG